jgi:ATP-binding cassette, subfamily C (CFTR/MRP), member 1
LNEFHERVPVGRIMNRLTKDMRELDESIGNSLTYFLNNSFTLIGTIIVCVYGSTLLMVVPVLIVMHLCNRLRIYYMQTQR